jgi:hypothetical protein
MNVLNRVAAVITPKDPYLNWANATATSYETLESMKSGGKVLLLPVHAYEDRETYLKENYRRMLELELEAWTPDRKTWPKQIDYDTFRQWFDVKFYALVVDFEEDNLSIEPYN